MRLPSSPGWPDPPARRFLSSIKKGPDPSGERSSSTTTTVMNPDPLWLAIFGPAPPRPLRPHPCRRLPRLKVAGVVCRRSSLVLERPVESHHNLREHRLPC